MYSFIEDWDRQDGACGHLQKRSANFFDPVISSNNKRFKEIFLKQIIMLIFSSEILAVFKLLIRKTLKDGNDQFY